MGLGERDNGEDANADTATSSLIFSDPPTAQFTLSPTCDFPRFPPACSERGVGMVALSVGQVVTQEIRKKAITTC